MGRHWAPLRRIARRAGFDLVRPGRPPTGLTTLESCLATALAAKGTLSIVQIGANDGLHGDPLDRFICAHRSQLSCVFIEPQRQPLSVLREHHGDAAGFEYLQVAVGGPGVLTLYSVAEKAWPFLKIPYAQPNWPDYRAPSGITSPNREHVRAWLDRHYIGEAGVETLIEAHEIACLSLPEVIEAVGWAHGPDVLQIDTEGHDDEVVYACSIGVYRPLLINYEHVHLSSNRRQRLEDFLTNHGYRLVDTGEDTLAVRW